MVFEAYWVRRRWWDARTGHTAYLMFALTVSNFILIAHRFFIENDPTARSLFTNLWIFVTFFLISYIPVSTLVGHWHRQTQLSTETTLKKLEDPLFAKMFRMILDVQTGKATKQEIEQVEKLLLQIEKGDAKLK